MITSAHHDQPLKEVRDRRLVSTDADHDARHAQGIVLGYADAIEERALALATRTLTA